MDKRIQKNQALMHVGENPKQHMGAVVPPIFQNSLFVLFDEDEAGGGGYTYSRAGNPTVELCERKLAELEEGEDAVCMGSGMAAISAAILHCVDAGDHIVCIRSCYGGTYDLLNRYIKKFGVEVTFVDGSVSDYEQAIRPNTKLFYLESPSTAIFRLQDLRALSALAKERNIRTVIDNTWATPLLQNPIALGVDIVVHSASKYLGGHSDIVAGMIVGPKADMDAIRADERMLLGNCLDPHAAWLMLRGMRTMGLRIDQNGRSAQAVAEFLEGRSEVDQVFFPGLKSHPDYELGKSQMSGYSSLMSFTLPGGNEKRKKFIKALKVFQNGCSWGGFESLVIDFGTQAPGELEQHGWHSDAVRIYVGLEDTQLLIDDLQQAFDAL